VAVADCPGSFVVAIASPPYENWLIVLYDSCIKQAHGSQILIRLLSFSRQDLWTEQPMNSRSGGRHSDTIGIRKNRLGTKAHLE